jgi:hypothetical protein
MATDAEKVKKYRDMANDKTVPQDVRNSYLDKANAIELKAFEDYKAGGTQTNKPSNAPASATKKKEMAKGGYATKTPMKMAKGGAAKTPMTKKPVIAIMIGVGKPKKDMAKGGMAKKGK